MSMSTARLIAGVACTLVAVATTACAAQVSPPSGSSAPATGIDVGSAPSMPVATPSAAAPAPGTSLLASLPTDGRINVIADAAGGFSVVQSVTVQDQDRSTVSVHDAAGRLLTTLAAGSLTGECGAADVVARGRRLLVTALITTQPAEGINAARYSLDLTAHDAQTGDPAWTTNLVSPETTPFFCSSYDGQLLGGPGVLAISSDGGSAVLHLPHGINQSVVGTLDLATGRLDRRPDASGMLGNLVVLDPDADNSSAADRDVALAATPALSSQGRLPITNSSQGRGVLLKFPTGSTSGVFTVTSAGSSPYSGVSDDGSELFAYEYDAATYSKLVAYRLSSATLLWSQQRPSQGDLQLVAEGGGVLVGRIVDHGDATMVGLDAATGKQRWSLPRFEVCGITRTQMLVAANQLLAVVDLASGRQVSFTGVDNATPGRSCPTMLSGGIAVGPGGPVVQALTP